MVNTWKIILATVIIFGAGVVTGGLVVRHADHLSAKQLRALTTAAQPGHWTPPLREFPRRPEQELKLNIEQRRIEFLLNASRELKLSPEQRERIERLIRESQERTRQLWERVGPQMRRELAEVKEKIREELTPQQRKRFEELMKRQQARRAEEAAAAPRTPRENRRPALPRVGPPPEVAPQPLPPSGNPPPSNP
jgi:hypothetical protein